MVGVVEGKLVGLNVGGLLGLGDATVTEIVSTTASGCDCY